jgi:hypothetical protein
MSPLPNGIEPDEFVLGVVQETVRGSGLSGDAA